jgi:hypothetical protein
MNLSGGVLIGNQTLVVQRVEVERRGLYTCIASNAVGDGESNAISLDIKCTYHTFYFLIRVFIKKKLCTKPCLVWQGRNCTKNYVGH